MSKDLLIESNAATEIGKKIGELKAHSENLEDENFENTLDAEEVEKWSGVISKVLKAIFKILD